MPASNLRLMSPNGPRPFFVMTNRRMAFDAAIDPADGDENITALIKWAKENLTDSDMRRLAAAAKEAAGMSEDDEPDKKKFPFPKNAIQLEKEGAQDAARHANHLNFPNANRLRRA